MGRGLINSLIISINVLMPLTIVLAFLWAPAAEGLGDFSRIIYFHVPLAWISVLAFLVSGILSIIYLFDKKKRFRWLDEKSYNSAAIGLAFAILTVITGSIWARLSWGSFWNWDPRETSILIILLIYIAYFSLQSAFSGNGMRGKIGSSYLILAMMTLPFLVFIVPRIYTSLHPDAIINVDKKIYLEGQMRVTLLISLLSFSVLYVYIFNFMNRALIIKKRIEENHEIN
jgi:heme exporter protein C